MRKFIFCVPLMAASSVWGAFLPGPFQISQPTVLGATVTFNGAQPVTMTQGTVLGATVTFNGAQPITITQPTVLGATVTFNGTQNVNVVSNSTVAVVSSTIPIVSGTIPPVTGVINTATSIIASTFTPVYQNASFTIWPGTSTGISVAFEASADSATSWQGIEAVQDNDNRMGSSFTLGTATTTWDAEIAGMTNFRVRATGWTTGFSSVTISIQAMPTSPAVNVTGSTVTIIQSQPFQIEPGTNPLRALVTGSTVTVNQSQPFQVEPGTNVFKINGTFSAVSVTTATYAGTGFAPIGAGIALRVSSTTIPTVVNDGAAVPPIGTNIGQLAVTGVPYGVILSTYMVGISSAQTGAGDGSVPGLKGETVLISSGGTTNGYTYLCGCVFVSTGATTSVGGIFLQSPAASNKGIFPFPLSATISPTIWPGCTNPFFRSEWNSNIYIYQTVFTGNEQVTGRCQYYQGP